MSVTSCPRILTDGLGKSVQVSDYLARWTDDRGFFSIFCEMWFDPGQACIAFRREQNVHWCYVRLEDPFFMAGVQEG